MWSSLAASPTPLSPYTPPLQVTTEVTVHPPVLSRNECDMSLDRTRYSRTLVLCRLTQPCRSLSNQPSEYHETPGFDSNSSDEDDELSNWICHAVTAVKL